MSEFDFGDPFADIPSPTVDEGITIEDNSGEPITVRSDSMGYQLAVRVMEKNQELDALEAANAATLQRQAELKAAKEALQKQMDEISKSLHEIETELFDYRRTRRELTNEISALRRQLSQVMFNEAAQAKLESNRLEFSKTMQKFNYAEKILKHQIDGAFILASNMRCILGDKRGAGKTLTSIAAWDMNQSQRVLVIVPDDVVSNFVNEIHYWAPHRNVMQVGKQTPAARAFAIEMATHLESFTIVCNYSAWRKDKGLIEDLIKLRFDTVVLDEAHEIKNTSTSAYKGVKQIVLAENSCPKCSAEVVNKPTTDGWSNFDACTNCTWASNDGSDWEFLDRCSIKMVVPMSGTVILNKPQDLFALLSLVDPINFTHESYFLRDYCQQNYYTGKWEFRSGGLTSLQKRLEGRYIAREGVKTPGQTIYTHDIEFDKELYPNQWRVIEQLSKHAQILLESGKKMTILATIALITRKRQANVWPAGIKIRDEDGNIIFDAGEDVQESIKLDKCIIVNPITNEAEGLIPELTEDGDMELGSRVVVFSQFRGPLEELENRLRAAGISCARLDGSTPEHKRDLIKMDFDRKYADADGYEPKWQVLLANYKTGGVGLNFTAATETIILDKEWNPGKQDQAFGRTDRLGQTEHTNVHVLRIPRTIDVWMDQINEEKENLIAGFNEATEPLNNKLLDAMKSGEIM
jgi:SNF2 family DNA or RNA helicase